MCHLINDSRQRKWNIQSTAEFSCVGWAVSRKLAWLHKVLYPLGARNSFSLLLILLAYHQFLLVFLLQDGSVVILVFRHDIGIVETWQRRCVQRKWNCKAFHSLSGTHKMSRNCELLKGGEFDFHPIVTHISTFKTSALVTSSPES